MMKKSGMMLAALAVGTLAATAVCVVAKKALRKKSDAPVDGYTRAEQAEQVPPDYYAAVREAYDNGPNENPINRPKVETPRTEDGKIDVTKLASPEDFCNWEEHGCQG